MWKYVSRRIKDTFERSANYFDVRSAAGVANSGYNEKQRPPSFSCQPYRNRRCWRSYEGDNNTNGNRHWFHECLNKTWCGAVTLSSALVIGLYAGQFLHLKKKYHTKQIHEKCFFHQKGLWPSVLSHAKAQPSPFASGQNSKPPTNTKIPNLPIFLVGNEQEGVKSQSEGSTDSASSSTSNDLSDVLNSIENKLGLAAIANGQFQDGLSMLRSAAHRHHPPALFNLGQCYELGLGLPADEKMAMELYRTAASLEHPSALYNLAIFYGQGRAGLNRDFDTAIRLLRLAALKGQENAVKALKSIEKSVEADRFKDTKEDARSYKYDLLPEQVVSTPTSLYTDQVNSLLFNNSSHIRCEATDN